MSDVLPYSHIREGLPGDASDLRSYGVLRKLNQGVRHIEQRSPCWNVLLEAA